MGRLKPGAFAALLPRWVRSALPRLSREEVGVDGKKLRGSGAGGAAAHQSPPAPPRPLNVIRHNDPFLQAQPAPPQAPGFAQ